MLFPGRDVGYITLFLNNQYPSINYLEAIRPPIYTGSHQGVTTDGTNLYLFHSNWIKKIDIATLSESSVNNDVNTESGSSHVGDGCYYDGKVYAACSNYLNCSSYAPSKIVVWNASDLSLDSVNDISAESFEAASLFVDADNIYLVSYCDGSKIWQYARADFSYIGAITLSSTITNPQGITKHGEYFYISTASNKLYKVTADGTIVEFHITIVNEGLDYTTDVLYGIQAETLPGILHFLQPRATNNWSMEFDWNPALASLAKSHNLLSVQDGNFSAYYDSSAKSLKIKMESDEGSAIRPAASFASFKRNEPNKIFAVYTGTKLRLYLNGVFVNEVTRDNTFCKSNCRWILGSMSSTYTLGGDVSLFRVYSRALTATEISQITITNDASFLGSVVRLWWNMIPVNGVMADLSGHSAHGTISGECYVVPSAKRRY
jgi:hypothetical protein